MHLLYKNNSMKLIIFLLSLCSISANAQKKSKFSLEVNYGAQANFFFEGYDELGGPTNYINFYKKNTFGSIGGVELKYHFNKMASFGIAYSNAVNTRIINYVNRVNSVTVAIEDFSIKHQTEYYHLFYERKFSKKTPQFKYHFGLFYSRYQQQEVTISRTTNSSSFEQRNFNNSKLEEGGAFVGIHYSKMIDTKFELGIRSRVYYLISTNEIETISLTPTLTYHF